MGFPNLCKEEGSVVPRWEEGGGVLLLELSVFKAEEQFPAGSRCPNSQETQLCFLLGMLPQSLPLLVKAE